MCPDRSSWSHFPFLSLGGTWVQVSADAEAEGAPRPWGGCEAGVQAAPAQGRRGRGGPRATGCCSLTPGGQGPRAGIGSLRASDGLPASVALSGTETRARPAPRGTHGPASLVWGPREQPPQTPSAKSKLRGALAQHERGLAQPQWGWLLGAPSSAPRPATPDWQRMERGQPGGLCSDATCV